VQRTVIGILGIVLFLVTPVSSSIVLFSPASDSLSSLGIKDITDGPENSILLATDNGRSTFNGTWEIVHVDRKDYPAGPLSDFVTALEYDHKKRLWIGYSNGLQILEGSEYTTINDQQLLKNLVINDLQSRGSEMWVATGHAGLHRYCDGIWTWFQPHGDGGLRSYEIRSMAVDYMTGSLYCAAKDGALWIFSNDTFERFAGGDVSPMCMEKIVSCPYGGIAGFNTTSIFLIDPARNVRQLANRSFLSGCTPGINDIAFTENGTLVIATNQGIVFFRNGTVTRHLTQADGIGNQVIEHVYVDNTERIWFFSQTYGGIFLTEDEEDLIVITAPTATTTAIPAETSCTPTPSIDEEHMDAATGRTADESPASFPDNIIDAILSAIEELFGNVSALT
jgi:ligand-binding sensor domain-containing protein